MVVKPSEPVEWETPAHLDAGHDIQDRCPNNWLGGPLPGHQDGRSVFTGQATDAHKLLGIISSCTGSKMLCKRQEHSHTLENGQHNCPQLHKQTGWHSLTRPEPLNKESMDMVPKEENHLTGHTPSWDTECNTKAADKESRVMKNRTDWMLCP